MGMKPSSSLVHHKSILSGIFPRFTLKQITLVSLKESNGAQLRQSMQSTHVTDAAMTSKMLLQAPVEIFKEPDAAPTCLPHTQCAL